MCIRDRGCTHLRELLLNLATAAIQTIPPHIAQFRGGAAQGAADKPFYVDQCYGWRSDGPAVIRMHPEFSTPARQENGDRAGTVGVPAAGHGVASKLD